MKVLKYLFIFSFLCMSLFSCKERNSATDSEGIAEAVDHHDENSNEVELTASQIKAIGLEFGSIEIKELTDVIRANGFLKVPNQNKAKVTSLFPGTITSIKVRPGEYVSKGQTIAVINNPEQILIQEQYLTVVSQIGMEQTEVKRQKELYEGNAGALKNLQYAESRLKNLQTQKASLSKQLQLIGINPTSVSERNIHSSMSVKAPISGVVGSVFADIGTYVDSSFPIADIVDNSNLHLDIDVFEKDLPYVKKGQIIHFTLTNNPVTEYDAEIFSVGSTFEDGSKAVAVHAAVMGDKTGLIEGMNVVAVISVGAHPVPAVPSEAIVNEGAEDFIFIYREMHEEDSDDPETVFLKIPVAKGTTDVGYAQITPLIKLPEDAKIVTKGAFFLMAKMSNTGEDDHHH